MKEIVEKLQEKRQIELAKSIMESAGYTVTKKVNESADPDLRCDQKMTAKEFIEQLQYEIDNDQFDGEYPEYAELNKKVISFLKNNRDAVIYFDCVADISPEEKIEDTGNDYFAKGTAYDDEEDKEYNGYILGNYDGFNIFIYIPSMNESIDESDDYAPGANTTPASCNGNKPLKTHQGTASTSDDGANNNPATANNNRSLKNRTGDIKGAEDYAIKGGNTTPNSSNYNRPLRSKRAK